MEPCELTMYVSAVAVWLSKCFSDDDLALLAAALTQLGDTLATIVTQRERLAQQTQDCAKPDYSSLPE